MIPLFGRNIPVREKGSVFDQTVAKVAKKITAQRRRIAAAVHVDRARRLQTPQGLPVTSRPTAHANTAPPSSSSDRDCNLCKLPTNSAPSNGNVVTTGGSTRMPCMCESDVCHLGAFDGADEDTDTAACATTSAEAGGPVGSTQIRQQLPLEQMLEELSRSQRLQRAAEMLASQRSRTDAEIGARRTAYLNALELKYDKPHHVNRRPRPIPLCLSAPAFPDEGGAYVVAVDICDTPLEGEADYDDSPTDSPTHRSISSSHEMTERTTRHRSPLAAAYAYRDAPQRCSSLPVDEVLLIILSFVPADVAMLSACSHVCRAWRQRVNFCPQWSGLTRRLATTCGAAFEGSTVGEDARAAMDGLMSRRIASRFRIAAEAAARHRAAMTLAYAKMATPVDVCCNRDLPHRVPLSEGPEVASASSVCHVHDFLYSSDGNDADADDLRRQREGDDDNTFTGGFSIGSDGRFTARRVRRHLTRDPSNPSTAAFAKALAKWASPFSLASQIEWHREQDRLGRPAPLVVGGKNCPRRSSSVPFLTYDEAYDTDASDFEGVRVTSESGLRSRFFEQESQENRRNSAYVPLAALSSAVLQQRWPNGDAMVFNCDTDMCTELWGNGRRRHLSTVAGRRCEWLFDRSRRGGERCDNVRGEVYPPALHTTQEDFFDLCEIIHATAGYDNTTDAEDEDGQESKGGVGASLHRFFRLCCGTAKKQHKVK